MSDEALRTHVLRVLDSQDAHVGFEAVIEGIPPELRGTQANGLPYSPWQLLEHMRIAQHDILDFCRNPNYHHEMKWPDDYWPKSAAPSSPAAWNESLRQFRQDLFGYLLLKCRHNASYFGRSRTVSWPRVSTLRLLLPAAAPTNDSLDVGGRAVPRGEADGKAEPIPG